MINLDFDDFLHKISILAVFAMIIGFVTVSFIWIPMQAIP